MGVERRVGCGGEADGGPLVVAWDTCTLRGVLAVGRSKEVLAEEYFEAVKGHTGWLMPQLDQAMKGLAMSPSDIDYVAAGIGPGTFTGVKAGVACAKAVSVALGLPLVGMSTLDVLAAGAPGSEDGVLALIDARRGQLYAAAYRRAGEERERVTEYLCATPAELAREVAPLGFVEVALVGESSDELVRGLSGVCRVTAAAERFPVGKALLLRASELIARAQASDPVSVSPIYLKKPT
jgi:tRNA threonylcarbamoyladenosine biosynthesis protein TsaB